MTTSSVLAKPEILKAVSDGRIFISNFDERQVNNCSYDIRLGEWFFEEQPSQGFRVYDPYSAASVAAKWGAPKKAVVPGAGYPVQAARGVIAIPPGGFVLAHTEEFIGCTDLILTTMVKARSTRGRDALQICGCAGWGDIGYATRFTLELKNNSRFDTIALRPGMRVGQIVFMPTTGITEADMYTGKYQQTMPHLSGLPHDKLSEQWDPKAMLPRGYEDWDAKEVTS